MIKEELKKQLEQDFRREKFVQCAIFSGASGTGKLSSSLEIAKRLTQSNNENILLYTTRNIQTILKNAYDNFMKKMDEDSTNYFLKEANIAFLRLATTSNIKKLDKDLKDDVLLSIENISLCSKYYDKISKDVEKIYKILSAIKYSQTISVDDIRNMIVFLNTTSASNNAKVVIIEGLENQNKAVNNAMLKILEEPPRDSLIIIITNNYEKLLKTIRSRSRVYKFSYDASEYIAKTEDVENIKSCAILYSKYLISQLEGNASFYNNKLELTKSINKIFDKSTSTLSQKERAKVFYSFVSANIKDFYNQGRINYKECRFLLKKIDESLININIFNQSVFNSLESLSLYCETLN